MPGNGALISIDPRLRYCRRRGKGGSASDNAQEGRRYYGYPTFGGGWAEYVTVKEWEVSAKPKSLTFAEAAAVPMCALTAWQALVNAAQLRSGQTILVHGG